MGFHRDYLRIDDEVTIIQNVLKASPYYLILILKQVHKGSQIINVDNIKQLTRNCNLTNLTLILTILNLLFLLFDKKLYYLHSLHHNHLEETVTFFTSYLTLVFVRKYLLSVQNNKIRSNIFLFRE